MNYINSLIEEKNTNSLREEASRISELILYFNNELLDTVPHRNDEEVLKNIRQAEESLELINSYLYR